MLNRAIEYKDILFRLADLQKQATTERSHYYVAQVCTEAIIEIADLRQKLHMQNESKRRAPNGVNLWRCKCGAVNTRNLTLCRECGDIKRAWSEK